MQLSWTGTAFKGRASPGHLRSHLLFPQMTDIQTQKTRLLEIPVPGIGPSLIFSSSVPKTVRSIPIPKQKEHWRSHLWLGHSLLCVPTVRRAVR